jgi:hypothetical protein
MLVDGPGEERVASIGSTSDTFDLSDWWKSNCITLPGFVYVFRTVLTNSPNSCPLECLFSIFNSTYNDDQKKSHDHYIELSIQLQFNKRDLYWQETTPGEEKVNQLFNTNRNK